jgi:hypothetical protein
MVGQFILLPQVFAAWVVKVAWDKLESASPLLHEVFRFFC